MDTKQPTAKLPSLRTYAKDLQTMRAHQGQNVTTTLNTTPLTPPPHTAPTPLPQKNKNAPTYKKSTPEPAATPTLKPLPSKIGANRKNTEIVTTSNGFVVDNEDAAAATIITDTKKNRFRLFPSMVQAVKNWFTEKQKERARKKIPRYTVPETTHRKGVIQKATSTTAKTTTADFASIQKRILERKRTLTTKAEHTSWSANTETGFLLLEAPEDQTPNNIQAVPKRSMNTPREKTAPIVLSRTTATPAATTPPLPIETIPTVPPTTTQTPTKVDIPLSNTTTLPSTPEEQLDTTTSETSVSEIPAPETPRQGTLLEINTNVLALGFSGLAIAIIAFGFYVYTIINENPTLIQTPETVPLIAESAFIKLPTDQTNRQALQNTLQDLRATVNTTTEIALMENNQEIQPAISTKLINPNFEQAFIQSVILARFGFSSEQVPFLMLQVSDITTARGSLLLAEDNLYKNLEPIFAMKSAGTSTKYIDANVRGIDVRVLKNADGQDILFYGIIDSTILITTNSLTFASLVPLISTQQ